MGIFYVLCQKRRQFPESEAGVGILGLFSPLGRGPGSFLPGRLMEEGLLI